jgi:N-acetylneuraminic acid mutarotase
MKSLLFLTICASSALAQPQSAPASGAYCWKTHASLPGGARQEHGVTAVGNTIYAVGGLQNGVVTGGTEIYDTATEKWSTIAALPTTIHHANVVTVGGKVYVLGGMLSFTDWSPISATFVYDPITGGNWTRLADMPNARGASAVGVHGTTVWIIGGENNRQSPVAHVSSYDTVSGKWTSYPQAPLPGPRDHGGGAVVGDTFVYAGGRTGAQTSWKGNTWVMNLTAAEKKWVEKASMPTPRGGIATAKLDEKIYTFGGEGNPKETSGVFSESQAYDPKTDSWANLPRMATPRHGFGAAVVGDRIYLPGGSTLIGAGKPVATFDSFGPGPC